jgi:hypothetical protein
MTEPATGPATARRILAALALLALLGADEAAIEPAQIHARFAEWSRVNPGKRIRWDYLDTQAPENAASVEIAVGDGEASAEFAFPEPARFRYRLLDCAPAALAWFPGSGRAVAVADPLPLDLYRAGRSDALARLFAGDGDAHGVDDGTALHLVVVPRGTASACWSRLVPGIRETPGVPGPIDARLAASGCLEEIRQFYYREGRAYRRQLRCTVLALGAGTATRPDGPPLPKPAELLALVDPDLGFAAAVRIERLLAGPPPAGPAGGR